MVQFVILWATRPADHDADMLAHRLPRRHGCMRWRRIGPVAAPSRTTRRHIGHLPTVAQREALGSIEKVHRRDSPWSTQARHLLRALLRECTYLPDSRARAFMSRHILGRFKKDARRAFEHRREPAYAAILHEKHKKARKAAQFLRRANEGERLPLAKILAWTYGRSGKRKAELLQPISPYPQLPELEKMLAVRAAGINDPTSDVYDADRFGRVDIVKDGVLLNQLRHDGYSLEDNETPITKRQLEWNREVAERVLHPTMRAVWKAQSRLRSNEVTSINPKQSPLIPSKNIWGRPTPAGRVRAITRRWLNYIQTFILPPLPAEEWRHLRDLAMGPMPKNVVRPRRPGLTMPPITPLEFVLKNRQFQTRTFRNPHAAKITPQNMQSLWRDVFERSPLVETDEDGEIMVTWGLDLMHSWRLTKGDERVASRKKRSTKVHTKKSQDSEDEDVADEDVEYAEEVQR